MQEKSIKSSSVLLQQISCLSTQSMAGQSSRVSLELGESQKICRIQVKELKGLNQYTNKKKGQTKTSREAPEVRPQLGTQIANQGSLKQVTQPKSGNCQVQGRTPQFQYEIFSHTISNMQQMSEIIQKIRSSRTHIFQAHMNIVPEGSSHTLPGRPNVRTMHLCPNPSTKFDQLQQPRQDQVLSS